MFTNDISSMVYQSENCVNYSELSLINLSKKYGVIFPEEKNMNTIHDYAHSISRERTPIMDNYSAYKELNELFDENNNIRIYLNFPIVFKIESDEHGIYYVNQKYNLFVFGETQKEVENNLVESFKDQLFAFGFENDNNLDLNAQTLKKNLLKVYKYAKKEK